MLSLARRLAIRQEVEATFAELDEDDRRGSGAYELRTDTRIGSDLADAAAVEHKPCADCPRPRPRGHTYCAPCARVRRTAAVRASEKRRRPPKGPRVCRACCAPCSRHADRCPPCAHARRQSRVRRQVLALQRGRHERGLCVRCARPVAGGVWMHPDCRARPPRAPCPDCGGVRGPRFRRCPPCAARAKLAKDAERARTGYGKRNPSKGIVVCAGCGAPTPRYSSRQQRCPPCAATRRVVTSRESRKKGRT